MKTEKTKCRFCGDDATHETQTNNVYVCGKNSCHLEYVQEIIKPLKQTK